MERRVALVDASNIAESVLIVGPGWVAPEGFTVVETAKANKGDVYDPVTGFAADNAPEPPPEEPPLADWQALRKALYREKIAAYKGRPNATHIDVMGFTMDAQIKAQDGDPTEYNEIKAIIDQVKADVPDPSS